MNPEWSVVRPAVEAEIERLRKSLESATEPAAIYRLQGQIIGLRGLIRSVSEGISNSRF